MVFAKDYGVPQNRPRVLLVGIREDILSRYKNKKCKLLTEESITALEEGFLPMPYGKPLGIKDLLSDLVDPKYPKGSSDFYFLNAQNETQEKLRITQSGKLMCKGDPLLDHAYSTHYVHIIKKFAHMIKNGAEIPDEFKTKKFAQRVLPETWDENGPNITAASLPDDFVHYSQPRSLTVREWARIQGFPDWYVFKGPRTTGGRRRAGDPSIDDWSREVPKYTQIGIQCRLNLEESLVYIFKISLIIMKLLSFLLNQPYLCLDRDIDQPQDFPRDHLPGNLVQDGLYPSSQLCPKSQGIGRWKTSDR